MYVKPFDRSVRYRGPPFLRFRWKNRFLWRKWKNVHDGYPILFSMILDMCANFHQNRTNNKGNSCISPHVYMATGLFSAGLFLVGLFHANFSKLGPFPAGISSAIFKQGYKLMVISWRLELIWFRWPWYGWFC